jgi:hypothetical protein
MFMFYLIMFWYVTNNYHLILLFVQCETWGARNGKPVALMFQKLLGFTNQEGHLEKKVLHYQQTIVIIEMLQLL